MDTKDIDSGDRDLKDCTLCPRNCHVDRTVGQTGYCGQTSEIKAARAALHMWEEPCISGQTGSGTVFFSGCNLGCVFCQNRRISSDRANRVYQGNGQLSVNGASQGIRLLSGNRAFQENTDIREAAGKYLSPGRLCEIFLRLQEEGACNVNLVTPSHFVPQLVEALQKARDGGLTVPVVYNTGSYEKAETLKRLEGLVDVYLPDLKYYSPELARRYSFAEDYFDYASLAIGEMVRQVGKAQFAPQRKETPRREETPRRQETPRKKETLREDAAPQQNMARQKKEWQQEKPTLQEDRTLREGVGTQGNSEDEYAGPLMVKGVLVRHLVLPGCVADSKAVLRYLMETYGNDIYVSIMNQYTPLPQYPEGKYPELNRTVTAREYEKAVDYAISQGLENGFIQEGETCLQSFIPEFDGFGL